MSEPVLLYVLVFVLVAIAVQQFGRGMGGLAGLRRQKRRRIASLGPETTSDDRDGLRRRSSRLADLAVARRAHRLVVQSGTSLPAHMLVVLAGGLAILLYLVLPLPFGAASRAAIALATSGGLLVAWLRIKRARRMARFAEQLPEIIDVIVRSLRAGHPLAVSLALVARETPEPAGPEFTLVVDEVNYGRSVTEALQNLYQRVGYPELRYFVAATSIAHQTGGNLGEILSRLSRMLRERFRLTRRVRALSAEGRFSGYALSVLPVALFGAINLVSASYYAEFWASAVAPTVLAVSLGLLVVGNLIIFRLVNFRV